MLMYGSADNIIPTGIVYNLTSMREGYPKLDLLIPPIELGVYTNYEFDVAYAQYILNNNLVFKQFFDIIYSLYIGTDVYLIIDTNSEWSENLIESLLKLIQQRYGYDGVRIDEYSDYERAIHYPPEFNTSYGLYNLDIDKERYTYMVEYNRIQNGGSLLLGEE